ncbi:DNA mismatch repair protein mlh1 [Anaeramoeba flamelloides]|uniref:DNA mismatch repair protein mlh1 n=1 Tax=Anaeramoeba flamelloides TaxID=1746091 RepID=A0ABQ8XXD3_9EUKA|nr:DNA mismatch repair protein mlh1 [Anaeramoeba flamelloides]
MEIKRIKKLNENTIRQIAAGEVVQRPTSALKELLENSLDAGSTQIKIHLKKGGMKLLRVIDNGCGIKVEDLPILCERFTTSKLRSFSDLQSVSTFGFRGEALSSISFVSHLTVITQPRGSQLAYRAHFKDGKLLKPRSQQNGQSQEEASVVPIAGIPGTQIEIGDLFYNQPSRLRSFKKTSEETNRILNVVRCYSINNPQVAFVVTQNEKALPLFKNKKTNQFGNSLKRIAEIYSLDVKKCLFKLQINTLINNSFRLKLEGYISNLNYCKEEKEAHSKMPHFILFINKRLVQNYQMKTQIMKVYKERVKTKGKPFMFFNLILPPECVDVNVHPTKKEVKFLHEAFVIDTIVKNIQKLFSNGLEKDKQNQENENVNVKEQDQTEKKEQEQEKEKEQEKVKDNLKFISQNLKQKMVQNKDEITLDNNLIYQQSHSGNNVDKSILPISDLTHTPSPQLPSQTPSPLISDGIFDNNQQNNNSDNNDLRGIDRTIVTNNNKKRHITLGTLKNENLPYPTHTSSSLSATSPFAKNNNALKLGNGKPNRNNFNNNNNNTNKTHYSSVEENSIDNRKRKIDHLDQEKEKYEEENEKEKYDKDNEKEKHKKVNSGNSKNNLIIESHINEKQIEKKKKKNPKIYSTIANTPQIQNKKPFKKKKHKPIILKTILELIEEFESEEHEQLTTIFRKGKLISVLDTDFALIQHNEVLYLCDIEIITREFLYQNVLYNFQNLNYIHYENGISLNSLLLSGLNSKHSGWGAGDGDKKEIADIILNLLNSQQIMLFDYFSIKIDKDNKLRTLPLVTPNYCPDPDSLPMFILRLGPEVEWETEKECFKSLALEISRFYTPTNRIIYKNFSSKLEKKQYLTEEKKRLRILFKEKIFPQLQKKFVAPQSLINNSAIIEIARVDEYDEIFD